MNNIEAFKFVKSFNNIVFPISRLISIFTQKNNDTILKIKTTDIVKKKLSQNYFYTFEYHIDN